MPTGDPDGLELEELVARRRQLFAVSGFAAAGAATIAAATLVWDGVELPPWVGVVLVLTTALFVVDAMVKERALREVTHAAIAEHARATQLEDTLTDLATLQRISRRVNAGPLPEEIYGLVLEGAVELLDGAEGTIRLRVEDRLTVAASSGPTAAPLGDTVTVGDDLLTPIVTLGITRRDDEPPRLAVPIHVGERIVGVLEVAREPGAERFTDRSEVMARLFADEAATAFLNANRFDHERSRADLAVSVSADRSAEVADTVHDLRAPLSAMVGFASLLRDRYDALDPAQRREAVDDIHKHAEVLDGRIAEIFVAASTEARATSVREPVGLDEVATSAVETVRGSARRRGWDHRIQLECEQADLVVAGDRDALERVVTNLVGNAVEHGGPDVLVRVQRNGGAVRVHVADGGAGIPEDRMDRLFDRRHTSSGRGRGLAIVDRLVRSMGGRVEVHSELDVGTVFSVVMPPAVPAGAPVRPLSDATAR